MNFSFVIRKATLEDAEAIQNRIKDITNHILLPLTKNIMPLENLYCKQHKILSMKPTANIFFMLS